MALVAIGISLAATAVLLLLRPDRPITLLIYLPGIAIVEALYGFWGGAAAVVLSVAGSAVYRIGFSPPLVPPKNLYRTWEEEIILLVVGLSVVGLMELRRRSGLREATGAHRLAALLHNVADAVVVFDRRLRVASMNPAAYAMLNRPGETLVGQSLESLRQRFTFATAPGAPQPNRGEVWRGDLAARAEGTVYDLEANRSVQVLISGTELQSPDGRNEGLLVLLTDITALKEMQRRALDSARHLAIAQMVSGLSHDFNHVLDIVRRALAVLELQENAPAAERRRYREMIENAALDGSQIVRRLRDYLAGGTGVMAPVDLAGVAHEAVELTRPLWRVRPGIEVVEDLQPVPAVLGNANDLRRLLTNLIFNAIEALGARAGRIAIHTAPCPGAHAPRVCAWVEDSGPGVAPEARRNLFQPYFTTKPHGLGMGLFGAQKIALDHGGTLDLVAQPVGAGARFQLELPALDAAARVPQLETA